MPCPARRPGLGSKNHQSDPPLELHDLSDQHAILDNVDNPTHGCKTTRGSATESQAWKGVHGPHGDHPVDKRRRVARRKGSSS